MDKTFLPVMSVMAFVLVGQMSVSVLNAEASLPMRSSLTAHEIEKSYENVKESGPVRNPPTPAEVQKAYENCLDHECGDFAEWSIKAAEVCSEGGQICCELAREILEGVHSPHVGEVIYDNYFPHSFEEDDQQGDAP